MVAIITGIIIDTFGELRTKKANIEKDEYNVCFICSLKRDSFERKGRSFADHIDFEHHRWNYIYYKMYLSDKKLTELTTREKYIKKQVEKQSVDYFPIGKSLQIANEETNDIGDQISSVEGKIENVDERIGSMMLSVERMQADIAVLTAAITSNKTTASATGASKS